MKKLWNKIGWVVLTMVGSAIFGAGYAIFLGPNGLNAGGISGLAAVLVELVNPEDLPITVCIVRAEPTQRFMTQMAIL